LTRLSVDCLVISSSRDEVDGEAVTCWPVSSGEGDLGRVLGVGSTGGLFLDQSDRGVIKKTRLVVSIGHTLSRMTDQKQYHQSIVIMTRSNRGQSAYLVIENDLETLGIGTNSLPSDGVSTASAPLGIVIRTGDLDGVDDGQQGESGKNGLGEHLRVSQCSARRG